MSCGNVPAGLDEAEGEALMPRRRVLRRVDRAVCHRCKAARSAMIVRSITYCRACFVASMPRRIAKHLHPPLFRGTPRSAYHHPPPQRGGAVLALSGGAGSSALFDVLSGRAYIGKADSGGGVGGAGDVGGLGDGAGREGEPSRASTGDAARAGGTGGKAYEKTPVWDAGWAVHVDFSGLGGASQADRLRGLAEERGWQFLCLRAEDVFDESLGARLGVPTGAALAVDLAEAGFPLSARPAAPPLDALRTLLDSLPLPSRPALLSAILDALVHAAAAALPNITHVLLGETATREAQRVVAGTASGRGWALPLELAVARSVSVNAGRPTPTHTPDDDGQPQPARSPITVTRLRPMKDVTVKEAAYYCHLRGIQTVNQRRWDSAGAGAGAGPLRNARGKAGSIEALTEDFIAGLDVSHPSTVSTINRTGDKLVFAGRAGGLACPVCQMPVDDSALDWKARSALTSLDPDPKPDSDSVINPPDSSAYAMSAGRAPPHLAPLLCYACLTALTLDKPPRPVPLPLFVGGNVARRVGASEMRAQIAGFMLDDYDQD
ncbi:Cytoplasmic tRNA 2-thiolation protein 2 [Cryptotrichosporon argae]